MSVFPPLSQGTSSIKNTSTAIDVIGNNIANVSTNGFKKTRTFTTEAFSNVLANTTLSTGVGNGTGRISTQRITSLGSVQTTDKDLDLANDGRGYFILKNLTDTDAFYTRDGNFSRDDQEFLIHAPSGKRVQCFSFDANGVLGTTLGDIKVLALPPVGKSSTSIKFAGNLDSTQPILGTLAKFTSTPKTDGFTIFTGVNDSFVYEVSGSATPITANLITDGGLASGAVLSGDAVAAGIKAALETTNGTADTYVVSYDEATDQFIIDSGAGNADTLVFRHDLAGSTASATFGFLASASAPVGPGGKLKSDFGVAFNVLTGINDTLTATIDGVSTTVTIAAGNYTGGELARAIESAFRASRIVNQGITVAYDEPGAKNAFIFQGPRSGGAFTVNQPSNAATPSVSFVAATVSITGGTLAPVTNFTGGTATAGAGNFDISDPFVTSSDFTSISIFDNAGNRRKMDVFFRKIGDNLWEWHGAFNGAELVGSTANTVLEEVASGLIRFTADGKLDFESTTAGTGVFNFDVLNGATPTPGQTVTFDFGTSITTNSGTGDDGMVQFGNSFSITKIDNDGIVLGQFRDISVGRKGVFSANFTNGQSFLQAQIGLALFNAPDLLAGLTDNLFQESNQSGTATITIPDLNGAGRMVPSALETSNVSLAEEFANLIVQQEIFRANSRIITVSDRMLETLVNI